MGGHATRQARGRGRARADIARLISKLRQGDPEEVLTTSQCSRLTGFSQQSFFNWLNRTHNPLKGTKPGREWQIRRGDLADFLERHYFRADDAGDEPGAAARDEGHAGARLVLLRPRGAPSANVRTVRPLESVDTREAAYQALEYLVITAEMALAWRRAVLTAGAAASGGSAVLASPGT